MKKINLENLTASTTYRNRVHDVIPGGAHTYTKGDDQFPLIAPAAIKRGLGAYVWDLDDNKYLDCSMGLTSVSLGHAYPPVLEAVKRCLNDGVNFQRPSYLELEMAEKFLSLLPGHDMIKFAKNGSTATTAAVKLARAFTGRALVAFPSDHPFYSFDDWFIGKTVCSFGVPETIASLTVTYDSKNLNSLEELFAKHPGQIACVVSEPERPDGIPEGYLKQLVEICHAHGALYVMDEMITGFKVDFPGAFSKYGVVPDLATWGKGIANGFSFCALTGKKEIMELGGIRNEGAQKVFLISSTHGGETHALAAGLATIEEFQKHKVVAHNHRIGRKFWTELESKIQAHGLQDFLQVSHCDWMVLVTCKDRQKNISMELRTLLLQEMIRRGVLFQGAFVPCFSHQDSDVSFFMEAMDESLVVYKQALEQGVEKFLVGKAVKPVFRKYL